MLHRFSAILFALMLSVSLCAAQSSDKSDKSKDDKDAKDEEVFHGGSADNINAIGSRNVGCDRGLGNWYSLDKQVAMGRQFAQEVEGSSRLITDPVINEYVNRIGQNLVRNSDAKVPFTIKIIDAEEPNAFTLPGGFMYVHSGAILIADDESELAGVMAHEIGHVAACHAARQATRGTLASLAMIPLIFVGGPLVGLGAGEAANLLVPAAFMKFSRNFEAQADYLGVQYAYKTGYDPVGMINFFEKLESLDKKKHGFITKAYETHPQTPDRIEKSQHEIATILPAREQYIIDTSEFQQMKSRLNAIVNHRRLQENKDEHPDLRRASTTDDKDKDTKQTDDDRPVLKKKVGGD